MKVIDYNCFIGEWPFHDLAYGSFAELAENHAENGISYGYVSSIQSIFYNDPLEAEIKLAKAINGTDYKHVLTINPLLDTCRCTLEYALEEFDVCAVKIVPSYHGYRLDDKCVYEVCDILKKKNLPLFVALSLEDIRAAYMVIPREVGSDEVGKFLQTTDNTTLLSGISAANIRKVCNHIMSRSNVYFDCANLKPSNFAIEKLAEEKLTDRMVYGSLAPIMCMKSTVHMLKSANISEVTKQEIMTRKI